MFEKWKRLLDTFLRNPIAVVASLTVKIVGLEVLCRFLVDLALFFTEQAHLQCLRNFLGDFAAHSKDVLHVAIVCVRPLVITIRRLNQLRRDSQFVASLGDAAFKQMTRVQQAAAEGAGIGGRPVAVGPAHRPPAWSFHR